MTASLYFHVPFCQQKCPYCQFYSEPALKLQRDYLQAVILEWKSKEELLKGEDVISVYLGGGTPSLLEPEVLKELASLWNKYHPQEVTLEANPDDITYSKVSFYHQLGINRISLGVQTFDDKLLRTLGRRHDARQAYQAVEEVCRGGIDNISIDLMYDLPGQTLDSWEETLATAISLPIQHLSLYNLTIEPKTPFKQREAELRGMMPSEEVSAAMLGIAEDRLSQAGFRRYEISAFARPGKLSLHNIAYWTGRQFLGYGPSAFSFWEGQRFQNISDLREYCRRAFGAQSLTDFCEKLAPQELQREQLVIQLRMLAGVDLSGFQQRYGKLSNEVLLKIEELKKQQLLAEEQGVLKLTARGVNFYDTLAVELI
ncbi:MAG: radical SAM family heme chaperone HemW [Chlamydiota bacterium]